MFRFSKKPKRQKQAEKELDQATGKRGLSRLALWQQALGNRAFGQWLHNDANKTPSQTSIEHGRPLDANTRARMEQSLSEDLSDVRVHTDSTAADLAQQHDAAAFAVGTDIGFAPGNYLPGTPAGDALLAHELAHVVQHKQQAEGLNDVPSRTLEQDANRAADNVVSRLWSGSGGVVSRIGSRAVSAPSKMRGGLRVQFAACSGKQQIQPPSFLGKHSLETWNTIKGRLEAGEALEKMLVVGPLLVLFTSTPAETAAGGGYPLEEQVRAVQAVPVIIRSRIEQDISLLLVQHGNDLTPEEGQYWERWLDRLHRAGRMGPEKE